MTRRLLACCALSVVLLGATGQQQPASAAGEEIAAVTSRGLVLIADAAGARPKVISDDPEFTRAETAAGWRLAWSPDGARLAVGTPTGVLVVADPTGIRTRVAGVFGFAWGGRSLYALNAAGLVEVRSNGTTRVLLPTGRLTPSGATVAIAGVRGTSATLARPAVDASAYGGPAEILALDLSSLRLTRVGTTRGNMFPQEPTLAADGLLLFIAGARAGHCSEWHGSVSALRTGSSRTPFAPPARRGSKAGVDIISLAPAAGRVWFTSVDFDDGVCFAASGDQAQHGRVGAFTARTGKTVFLPLAGSSVAVNRAGTRLAVIDAIVTSRSEYPEVAAGALVTASPRGTGRRTLLDGAVAAAWRPAATS